VKNSLKILNNARKSKLLNAWRIYYISKVPKILFLVLEEKLVFSSSYYDRVVHNGLFFQLFQHKFLKSVVWDRLFYVGLVTFKSSVLSATITISGITFADERLRSKVEIRWLDNVLIFPVRNRLLRVLLKTSKSS